MPPTYGHLGLVLAEDRSKLSKRHGATSVNQFKQEGFLPEAMVNYLSLLGWSDGTDQEIFTIKELQAAGRCAVQWLGRGRMMRGGAGERVVQGGRSHAMP